MKPYVKHTSIAALLNRSNVDTDQIIPKQFLKKVERSGFGIHLFHDWRYLPDGRPNPDFELNKPAFQGAKILVTGDNFGCGSSREHAPWAIADYGFNTIIATSFADIFFNNCFKNGILPITVSRSDLDALIAEINGQEGARFSVDPEEQTVQTESGRVIRFTIDDFRKKNLLKGLDEIGLTLEFERQIAAYEAGQKTRLRWLWN